jgi:hypothetical protein
MGQFLMLKTMYRMSNFQLEVGCGGAMIRDLEAYMQQGVATSFPCS